MTIIVFLLDTSASMNQRVFLGGRPTLLDVAKSAVETFVKVRQRSPDSRQDRYMLLTFEEPPINIKAGWKENLATFMSELKNLQANGLTTLGHALRHTFDVLNVNRMQHGIDTYGQGRCPFYLEPSIIVAITDGGRLSSNSGVQEELKMVGQSPGAELTREPFRWDQRLFSLVLRMSGQPAGDRETGLVPSDLSPIDAMCEVTGGRSYCITTHRMLHQCIDSLVQKVQAGVVIHFEKVGNDPPPLNNNLEGKLDDSDDSMDDKTDGQRSTWHNSRKMIYVPRSNQKGFAGGFWPIPEGFWPDPSIPSLPPRTAHPHVKFTCIPQDPLVVDNFPFDKYELEPSPLTQYILARKQPTVCWQAYMSNSSKNVQLSQPFGYLKASTNLTCVNLFVMPHNYPILLPLLDDLFRLHRLKPSNEWRAQFGMYLSQMPGYYAGPLKRALIRMGATNIAQTVPDETYLSYSVLNYLKKLKTQAKLEYERTCNEVGARVKLNETKRIVTSYKNPFDVPRHQLLEHLAKLRTHFMRPTPFSDLQQDTLHSMPVAQMGNYQEYLKRQPTPLREIESIPVRQHMFGNPFKIDKRILNIDEADIDFLGQNNKNSKKELQLQQQQMNQLSMPMGGSIPMSPNSPPAMPGASIPRGMKRKPGPLPPDYYYTPKKSRSSSASSSPTSSPWSSPLRSPGSLSPFGGSGSISGLDTGFGPGSDLEILDTIPISCSPVPALKEKEQQQTRECKENRNLLFEFEQAPSPKPQLHLSPKGKDKDKNKHTEKDRDLVILENPLTPAPISPMDIDDDDDDDDDKLSLDFGKRSKTSNSFLSESMTLALWTDEDFQERETDDDLKEELPDINEVDEEDKSKLEGETKDTDNHNDNDDDDILIVREEYKGSTDDEISVVAVVIPPTPTPAAPPVPLQVPVPDVDPKQHNQNEVLLPDKVPGSGSDDVTVLPTIPVHVPPVPPRMPQPPPVVVPTPALSSRPNTNVIISKPNVPLNGELVGVGAGTGFGSQPVQTPRDKEKDKDVEIINEIGAPANYSYSHSNNIDSVSTSVIVRTNGLPRSEDLTNHIQIQTPPPTYSSSSSSSFTSFGSGSSGSQVPSSNSLGFTALSPRRPASPNPKKLPNATNSTTSKSNTKPSKKRVTESSLANNVNTNAITNNAKSKGVSSNNEVHKTKSTKSKHLKIEMNNKKKISNVPTLDEETIRQQNLDLRRQLFAEIRRPIFRMDDFLNKLTEIAGPEKVKIDFLKTLEKEATRFKRKRVAELLARQILG